MLLACVGDGTAVVDEEDAAVDVPLLSDADVVTFEMDDEADRVILLVTDPDDTVEVVDPDTESVVETVEGGPVTTLKDVVIVVIVGVKVG